MKICKIYQFQSAKVLNEYSFVFFGTRINRDQWHETFKIDIQNPIRQFENDHTLFNDFSKHKLCKIIFQMTFDLRIQSHSLDFHEMRVLSVSTCNLSVKSYN